jgi:hypothetical protein
MEVLMLRRDKKNISPILKKMVKTQMLKKIQKCETFKTYCRFAVPGYCLEEFSPWSCPEQKGR